MSTVYAPELRTPPLPLVAFIGGAEYHKEIGAFFSHVLRPPIITVGIAEPHEQLLAKLFGPRKPTPANPGPPAGILKADWFVKHRQRKASVALAIISRSDVDGDPSSWNRMLYQLRIIRDAASGRGAGFLVAVIQDATAPDVPADRTAAICGHLQLDPRLFVTLQRPANYSPSSAADPPKAAYSAQLKALGKVALELACAYYQGEVARRVQKHSVRMAQLGGACPAELNARVAFKLAVMAEFRQEWANAITQYQAAYAHVQEVSTGNPLSYQRHAEVTRVAEQVHFKTMMLLLHQNRFDEAVLQLKHHLSHFIKPPEPLPHAAQAGHLGWVSRQFLVAADMLRSKLEAHPSLQPHREASPPYLQLSAAQAGIRRREAAEAAWQSRLSTPLAVDVSSVKRGPFVGQVVLRAEAGVRDLSDAEYLLYLEAEEGKVHHTGANLELLSGALLLFKDTPFERLRSHLGVLMAQEHVLSNSLPNARKLLLQVSHTYRREGWEAPLLQVLGQLRECAQRLKSPREYVAFTLEITALHNALDPATNKKTADIAITTLRTGISAIKASIMKSSSPDKSQPSPRGDPSSSSPPSSSPANTRFDYTIEHLDLKDLHRPPQPPPKPSSSPRPAADPPEPPRPALSADLFLRHHQQDYGWWRCIALSAGFAASPPDPPHLDFHIALHNNLPTAIPLQRLEVHFSDDQGDFLALASPTPPTADCPPSPTRPCGPPTDPPPAASPSVSPMPSPRNNPIVPPSTNPPDQVTAATDRIATLGLDQPPPSGSAEDRSGGTPSTAAAAGGGGSWPAAALQACKLRPQQWQELHVRLQPRCMGRLKALRVVMVLSEHSTLTWKLNTFPAGQVSLGNLHLTLPTLPFKGRPEVTPGALQFGVQHVGRLPTLELHAPHLPLTCEHTPIRLTITALSPLPPCELELSLKSPDPSLAPSDLTLLLSDPSTPSAPLTPIPVDGHRIRLPPLTPPNPLSLSLLLRCAAPSKVTLSTTLFCPAIVHRSLDLTFHPPFEYQTWFTSEANVHTLTVPAKPLPTAGGAAVMPAGAPTRGPGSMPLTIGQPVLLTVLAQALQDCSLQLLDAAVELAPGSGLQLMSELRNQLEPSGLVLARGDIHTFLLHICPTLISTTPSMGKLVLTCRRCPSAPSALPPYTLPPSSNPPSTSSQTHHSPPDPTTTPAPYDTITLPFDLPRAAIQDSILTVRVVSPSQATAGIAFSFSIQIQNFTPQPQDLQISVTDTQGFVCDGDREQTLSVLPRDRSSVTWLLVAHGSGQLMLPTVRVAALRYNCSVVSQQSHVYVAPF